MRDLVNILPDYDEKLGNMNASVLAARDAESAGYAHYMAKMLAATDAQRVENRKLQEIRKQRHGIDPTAQQPSTQAVLARPKEDDLGHFLRPLPKEVIEQSQKLFAAHSKGDYAAISSLVAERAVTLEEVSHVEAIRRRSKNTKGQSEKSAFSEEKKEAGTHAFICSPGIPFDQLSPEDKERLRKPIQYESPPLVAKEAPQKDEPGKIWGFSSGATILGNILYRWRHRK